MAGASGSGSRGIGFDEYLCRKNYKVEMRPDAKLRDFDQTCPNKKNCKHSRHTPKLIKERNKDPLANQLVKMCGSEKDNLANDGSEMHTCFARVIPNRHVYSREMGSVRYCRYNPCPYSGHDHVRIHNHRKFHVSYDPDKPSPPPTPSQWRRRTINDSPPSTPPSSPTTSSPPEAPVTSPPYVEPANEPTCTPYRSDEFFDYVPPASLGTPGDARQAASVRVPIPYPHSPLAVRLPATPTAHGPSPSGPPRDPRSPPANPSTSKHSRFTYPPSPDQT
jgi:hypothetical protein